MWAATTFAILFVNFPTWDHHFVYLLPPLAIGAALLLTDVGIILFNDSAQKNLSNRTALIAICMSIAAIGTFSVANSLEQQQITPDITVVAAQIAARTEPSDEIWADNQAILLFSKRRGNPQLIDFSVKRIIAGELPEQELFDLFEQQPPAAVINYDGLFNAFPRFNACLAKVADVTPISLNNQQVYWVRRADIASFMACDKGGT